MELVKRVSVKGAAPALENLVALTGKPAFKFPVIEKKARQLELGLF